MCIRDSVVTLPTPTLIDEWQLVPEVWDRVRRAVDDDSAGCLLYTSDAADERSSVDLGGRRIIKKKKTTDISHTKIVEYTNSSTHTSYTTNAA